MPRLRADPPRPVIISPPPAPPPGRGTPLFRLFCDACARGNPGPAACGVLLVGPDGAEVERWGAVLGRMTNNEAEYRGLLAALDRAAAAGARAIRITMDSELVVRQVRGEYRVRAPHLRALLDEVRRRAASFPGGVVYDHAPRETDAMRLVDRIANETLDSEEER